MKTKTNVKAGTAVEYAVHLALIIYIAVLRFNNSLLYYRFSVKRNAHSGALIHTRKEQGDEKRMARSYMCSSRTSDCSHIPKTVPNAGDCLSDHSITKMGSGLLGLNGAFARNTIKVGDHLLANRVKDDKLVSVHVGDVEATGCRIKTLIIEAFMIRG